MFEQDELVLEHDVSIENVCVYTFELQHKYGVFEKKTKTQILFFQKKNKINNYK